MTGVEHLEAAEGLLQRWAHGSETGALAAAQVHALLALAAATAGGTAWAPLEPPPPDADWMAESRKRRKS